MSETRMAALLLHWYAKHARVLPWRRGVSPYRVWVSEVMLQQTRVESVIPYYRRWMRRFPSMRRLAAASERSVLSLWEGLGYYSRALSLHRSARMLVRERGGRLPSETAALRALPGIGDYIAGAIASIAFGRDEPALDGNVRRVLARVSCARAPVESPKGKAHLRRFAEQHLPPGRAGEFNQALMDLGALICVPRRPRCELCPLEGICEAHRRGLENRIPVRRQRPPRPHYHARAAVIVRGNKVLLVRRGHSGLLGGLWEFPKSSPQRELPSHGRMVKELHNRSPDADWLRQSPGRPLGTIEHTYSHFSITLHAFLHQAAPATQTDGQLWVSMERLHRYPMGKVDRTIARRLTQLPLSIE